MLSNEELLIALRWQVNIDGKKKPSAKELVAIGCFVTWKYWDDQVKGGDVNKTRCLCQTANKFKQNLIYKAKSLFVCLFVFYTNLHF
jgi:hypothetical protein